MCLANMFSYTIIDIQQKIINEQNYQYILKVK